MSMGSNGQSADFWTSSGMLYAEDTNEYLWISQIRFVLDEAIQVRTSQTYLTFQSF